LKNWFSVVDLKTESPARIANPAKWKGSFPVLMESAVRATEALIPCRPDAHPAAHQAAPAAKTDWSLEFSNFKLQASNCLHGSLPEISRKPI
jgi:hypothetical protein